MWAHNAAVRQQSIEVQHNSLNPLHQSSAIRAEMQDTRRLYCAIHGCKLTDFNDFCFHFL